MEDVAPKCFVNPQHLLKLDIRAVKYVSLEKYIMSPVQPLIFGKLN